MSDPDHIVTKPRLDSWNVGHIVDELNSIREQWRKNQHRTREEGGREFPSREALQEIVVALRGILFPMRLGPPDLRQESENYYIGHTLDAALNALFDQVRLELAFNLRKAAEVDHKEIEATAHKIIREFASALPNARRQLDTDVQAAYSGDPAARSVDEVLLCYPGILAIIHHRLAHLLYRLGAPLVARIIAEISHSETGIDIHPGASIGDGFFIDHGTGVVIGETAVIGSRVRIYQAVTLGAKRFEVGEDGDLTKGQPRHPIVEDEVVIYAGATILGRITIGRGAVIGGNVWLTRTVPPGSHVAQATSQQAQTASAVGQ